MRRVREDRSAGRIHSRGLGRTLTVSTWMSWNHISLRVWLIAALVGHFTARVWSFAYFIPKALRFEKLDKLAPEDVRSAHRWVRLSRCRPFLAALSIAALAFVLTHLASTVTSR
jgi:hypothetical protein